MVDPEAESEMEAVKDSKQEGKIVGVLQRNWRTLCGSLQETNLEQGNVLFVAMDPRYPKIRIHTRQVQELLDKRISVSIDSWPTNSHYPVGHYIRTIGRIGDRAAETEVIMMEHGVTEAIWSDRILKSLPSPDWTIPEEEVLLIYNIYNLFLDF